jgi:hypothetical protein
MDLFAFLPFSRKPRQPRGRELPVRPQVEALEDRFLPSANVISGYVYQDSNHDGLMDNNEPGLGNVTVELRDTSNKLLATTQTNASGFYQFTQNNSVSTTPQTITKTLNFASTQVKSTQTGGIAQFDPSLGALQSVTVQNNTQFTIETAVQNLSTTSSNHITVMAVGSAQLAENGTTIVNTPFDQTVGTFDAAPSNGTNNFTAPSGKQFDPVTLDENGSATLTGADMQAFIGTGNVSFTETLDATSQLQSLFSYLLMGNATGQADVTVTYTYVPTNSLQTGNYIVDLPNQPTFSTPQGNFPYLPGLESQNGTAIPGSAGLNKETITLTSNGTSTGNNFGELYPASLHGHVYYDANDNGKLDAGDSGLGGVTVTLTGSNDLGAITPKTTKTAADGTYNFWDLRPGNYTLTIAQPSGYLVGTDTPGTAGGSASAVNTLSNINLNEGTNGNHYDFGEVKPASVAGTVYFDQQNDGHLDTGDPGISGVTVTLSGKDDHGNSVTATTTTDNNGK